MSTLTDRYLRGHPAGVPAPSRPDIDHELRARHRGHGRRPGRGGETPTPPRRRCSPNWATRQRLAAGYADRRLHLIGPTYYLVWQRVLRLLLTTVPGVVGVVVGVLKATVGDEPGAAIGAGINAAFQTAVQIAFWVTVSFAVLERTDTSLNLPEWRASTSYLRARWSGTSGSPTPARRWRYSY